MSLTNEQSIGYEKATYLCSKSEHCAFDIKEKLCRWGLSPTDVEPVIEKLVREKFIDDERFARAYAKDKFRFNNWGKQKIAYMLKCKKISSEIIELAFAEIDDENYSDKLSNLLISKAKTIIAKDEYDKRNKLMRFALGRGFEMEQVNSAIKKLLL